MRIDMWVEPYNGNVEGIIVFELRSGKYFQIFRREWTVINTGQELHEMKKECLKCLLDIRLKELNTYLFRQLDENIILSSSIHKGEHFPTHERTPLESDWRIE